MKRIFALITLAAALTVGALAQDRETIQSVTEGGEVIILQDGSAWQVDASDRIDTALWQTGDDVVVVNDDAMINVDENGERAEVTRIR
jgi:hypothetical protein